MLGAITGGADWAMAADVIVILVLCGLVLYSYWKELKEVE